jgi:hypothetical protein
MRVNPPPGFCFDVGNRVFLRPVKHAWFDDEFIVTRRTPYNGWPHYELMGPDGHVWHASQIELSPTPFGFRP